MYNERHRGQSERGQSEIIGYVLVFSVALIALLAASMFGLAVLEDVQEMTATQGSEHGMQTIGADIEAIYSGSAMSRTTELDVQGALQTGPESTIEVTVSGGGRLGSPTTVSKTFRPLVYSTDRADLVYENTLLVRDQSEGAIAVSEPLGTFSADRAIVPMVLTRSDTVQSVGGGTHEVESIVTNTDSHAFTSDTGQRVSVVLDLSGLTPDRADVWMRALNARLEGVPSPRSPDPPCYHPGSSDDAVRCEFDTNTVVVSVTEIEYDLR